MTELRCGNCNHWLGEASRELVFVSHVDRGPDAEVSRPRDLRLCKSCGRVNVFVQKDDLDLHMEKVVG